MRGPHSERDSGPFQEANGIYTDFIFLPAFPDLCFLYIIRTYTARPRDATGFCGRRRLPLPIRSTLDSVFFYNKTSINLKGVPVCLGPLTLTGGQEGHSVGSRLAWAGEGCLRGMSGAGQSRVSGVLGARRWDEPPRAAVLHCAPGASVTPTAEKWERAPSHPTPPPPRGSWEEEGETRRPQEHRGAATPGLVKASGSLLHAGGGGVGEPRFHLGSFRIQPPSLTSMSPSSAAL